MAKKEPYGLIRSGEILLCKGERIRLGRGKVGRVRRNVRVGVLFTDRSANLPSKKKTSLEFDAVTLAAEASTVVGLRMAQAALGGPDASDEAWRMWSEKVVALNGLYWKMLAGGWGMSAETAARTTMRHYLPLVRANRRRLTQTSKSSRSARRFVD